MKKLSMALVAALCLTLTVGAQGTDPDTPGLVNFYRSNQSIATFGFETNEHDWILLPTHFSRLNMATLSFAFDRYSYQFTDATGTGVGAAFGLGNEGLSPVFAVTYDSLHAGETAQEADNIATDYTNYDTASGTYATVTQSINRTLVNQTPNHDLKTHLGLALGGQLGLALQVEWLLDKTHMETVSYTDTYTNTAAPSDATLSSRGNRTVTVTNLYDNRNNVLEIEPEIGLALDGFSSLISIGFGMWNLRGDDSASTTTVSSYGGGVDPTRLDQETITAQQGAYHYTGAVSSSFAMGLNTTISNQPTYAQSFLINLDSNNALSIGEDAELILPVRGNLRIYPDQATNSSSTTVTYDDSVATPREQSRTSTTTTTALTAVTDWGAGFDAGIRKTFRPADTVNFHLGGKLVFDVDMYADTRSQSRVTRTQVDNNGDGAYTTAGTDVDTTYTESGYEVQISENNFTIGIFLPVAASFAPADALRFYAGGGFGANFIMTADSYLTSGSNAFLYEQFTDNLVAANTYARRQKDGSNNQSTPFTNFETDLNVTAMGYFGVTVDLAENFSVDALAQLDSLSFHQFRLMGIYSF